MSLTQITHRAKDLHGDKRALVYADRVTSFKEFHQQVALCASAFVGLAPGDDVRVGILSLNSDRAIVSFHAAIWAGMVPNYLNIRWAAFELSQSIDDFTPSILVVDDTFLELGREMRKRCDSVESLVYIGEQHDTPEDVISFPDALAAATPLEDCSGDPDSMAFLNYTGGTTGKSKGVIHSHNTHLAAMTSCVAENFWRRGNSALVTPLFHISGIAVSNVALMLGNTLFIMPAFEPGKFLQLVQDARIKHMLLVPTMIKMMLEHPTFGDFDLSSLKYLVYGASPIDDELIRQAREKLPGAELMQIYGQTECVPASFLFDEDHCEAGFISGRTRSAGHAALGVDIKIRDEQGNCLGAGEVGEISMRAPFTMKGYLNMPEQTARTLRDGWLYTGDAGYLSEDNYLYVVDRMKDMIITGAENVYSAEVENALHRHDAVLNCAVVGLPHDTWGEMVHAEVVLKPEQPVNEQLLIEHCREFIAGYKIPKSIAFVDEIPLTAVGKIDKVTIREKYA